MAKECLESEITIKEDWDESATIEQTIVFPAENQIAPFQDQTSIFKEEENSSLDNQNNVSTKDHSFSTDTEIKNEPIDIIPDGTVFASPDEHSFPENMNIKD